MEIKFYRKKFTFSMWIYYKKNNEYKFIAPVIQFSFVEPWYYPKIDRNYKGINLWLCGWLCVYFGFYYKGNRYG